MAVDSGRVFYFAARKVCLLWKDNSVFAALNNVMIVMRRDYYFIFETSFKNNTIFYSILAVKN